MSGYDPYPFPSLNQSQLGEYFGVTSHVVGRWLKDCGMRLPNSQPSEDAIAAGVAVQVDLADGRRPFWAWGKEAAIKVLEASGHRRLGPPKPTSPPPLKLTGPFTAHQSDPEGDGFEIADSHGVVALWCRGQLMADRMVKLLNLCQKNGIWF